MDIKDFVDEVKVYLKAGDGGNGCVSFRREKFVPFGGPNGGNGGKGGDIYIVASKDLNTLTHLALKPHIKAQRGEHGKGSNKYGKGADDTFIYVPCGTIVKDINNNVLCDLKADGEKFLACRGGEGGRGNTLFKTPTNRAPDFAEKGGMGEEKTLILELSIIADIGLVGFPNAGKSSLLSIITHATPKVASYPFTTLNPNIGVAYHKGKYFVVADIPGLIEGASSGKGLGDKFLKHLLRTKILVHIIDPLGFYDIEPVKSVSVIEEELANYSRALLKKKRILVVNKSDLDIAEKVFKKIKSKYKKEKVFLISAATGDGVEKLLDYIIENIDSIKPDIEIPSEKKNIKLVTMNKGFHITRENNIFYITGESIEKLVYKTDINNGSAMKRLFNIFKKIGLIKELEKKGIKDDDTVVIGKSEFTWKNYY